MTEAELVNIVEMVSSSNPFYIQAKFWISTILSVAGVIFSIMSYREARAAKKAEFEAGKTVKLQTITIELTEIAQRLDKLDFELSSSESRDLLNEISRRLSRLIAPFQDNKHLVNSCQNLKTALD